MFWKVLRAVHTAVSRIEPPTRRIEIASSLETWLVASCRVACKSLLADYSQVTHGSLNGPLNPTEFRSFPYSLFWHSLGTLSYLFVKMFSLFVFYYCAFCMNFQSHVTQADVTELLIDRCVVDVSKGYTT